jgi:hypothetical protein
VAIRSGRTTSLRCPVAAVSCVFSKMHPSFSSTASVAGARMNSQFKKNTCHELSRSFVEKLNCVVRNRSRTRRRMCHPRESGLVSGTAQNKNDISHKYMKYPTPRLSSFPPHLSTVVIIPSSNPTATIPPSNSPRSHSEESSP